MTEHRLANFPAIATAYAGFNFRSRLEAKYAVFFDLCKWPWTYEPETEFNGWIPDFAIGAFPTYVEVKPFYRISEWLETIGKIKASGCRRSVLLLGADPVYLAKASVVHCEACEIEDGVWMPEATYRMDKYPFFCGVLAEQVDDNANLSFDNADDVRRVLFGSECGGRAALSVVDHGTWIQFTTGRTGGSKCELFGEYDHSLKQLQSLWSQACNVVQWMPKVNRQ